MFATTNEQSCEEFYGLNNPNMQIKIEKEAITKFKIFSYGVT